MSDHIGGQPIVAAGVGQSQHCCSAQGGVPAQGRLDFAQLDPEASDFDLVVDAALKIDPAVGQVAGQIPALVKALSRPGCKGVGDESLSRPRRARQVPPGQAG